MNEHNGKTLRKKQLTKDEEKYLDLLEGTAFFAPMFLAILIMCIIEH